MYVHSPRNITESRKSCGTGPSSRDQRPHLGAGMSLSAVAAKKTMRYPRVGPTERVQEVGKELHLR
ncbi:hypothetical protein EYF80_042883 [Liparis tanakae]|uniref:Uncharacterized protein n=1 Tax=Liparis tanakae TaxID=230148 RepID=A0A4Z2G305_9TELE|nr:hypothetical protein EYF80_042883 [Liparis tanakae]